MIAARLSFAGWSASASMARAVAFRVERAELVARRAKPLHQAGEQRGFSAARSPCDQRDRARLRQRFVDVAALPDRHAAACTRCVDAREIVGENLSISSTTPVPSADMRELPLFMEVRDRYLNTHPSIGVGRRQCTTAMPARISRELRQSQFLREIHHRKAGP
ncbi:hypothetical protein [Caballeronia sp. S22]|uniref:hypothetical protein n=1 Tax=Caballeronia sp. S22 TaxID=3137182 RepID=UPI0035315508